MSNRTTSGLLYAAALLTGLIVGHLFLAHPHIATALTVAFFLVMVLIFEWLKRGVPPSLVVEEDTPFLDVCAGPGRESPRSIMSPYLGVARDTPMLREEIRIRLLRATGVTWRVETGPHTGDVLLGPPEGLAFVSMGPHPEKQARPYVFTLQESGLKTVLRRENGTGIYFSSLSDALTSLEWSGRYLGVRQICVDIEGRPHPVWLYPNPDLPPLV